MKITYEIDTNDESNDQDLQKVIAHKAGIMCALYDLGDLYRIVWNRKLYDETSYKVIDGKTYIDIDWVENKLKDIFCQIDFLLE